MARKRFNVQKEELSSHIQDAIHCIEAFTYLKFTTAEDWTKTNQGHILHFEGELYKGEHTWYDIERYIKMQFAHNPSTKCLDEDTSDFEDFMYGNNKNEYLIYISI